MHDLIFAPAAAIFVLGFACGYGVRAYVSYRRRHRHTLVFWS